MTQGFFDDHTAQYKKKLPSNAWQVASKGLISSAVTESLSIQHLAVGENQGAAAGGAVVIGLCGQSAPPPVVSVSALV